MLALFAEELRIRVWEQKDAVVEHDLAGLASRVPGQPRMADAVDIASPNALAHLKQGHHRRVVARSRDARFNHSGHRHRKHRRGSRRAWRGLAACEFFFCNHSVLHYAVLEGG